ncbi:MULTISPECIES: OmpH family outer membrane protein [Cupriavidus]|uniref:Periplasmic chaperone for outer membrane proteins Skp n=2 Tax=Cupriavidus TaxID=106589 RepID=A0A316EXS7_9BURK|nr:MULTISPECIES: OmpH family outer membrane protein [Cupriavidus]NYH98796.1 outer membrane protein [Cupriavidus plantarum]PWK37534.1 periplasmic chaperone for outer membrane proteins Skp [Cupriavidus plantarum]QET01920.1 OmpH family outer membrane protein [Cupriavidus pauculus]REF01721.1 periplasmic chaperone for outer membrane proteins Skp [Cupriavidus plantarum]RLK45420.1 periplasmic chaperone for outer membrane proteins Skp [Cupriavidus plantarum]
MKLHSPLMKSLSAAALAAAALCAAAPAMAQEARIAAVNSERILRDSQPAKAAQVKLEQEFSKRDRELQDMAQKIKGMADKLDKDTAVLADSDRQRRQREVADLDREFQRKQREFREDLNQRRNEELAQVLERANRVIRSLAEQRKYDLIVQEAVYVNPRIDITDDVMKALNASTTGAK